MAESVMLRGWAHQLQELRYRCGNERPVIGPFCTGVADKVQLCQEYVCRQAAYRLQAGLPYEVHGQV